MKTLFEQEVSIRLTDDASAFVRTVKYGRFFSKSTLFPLKDNRATASSAEDAPLLVLRRPRRRAGSEEA
jgi:hypothetical protein